MAQTIALIIMPWLLEGNWGRERVFVVEMETKSTNRLRLLDGEGKIWVWTSDMEVTSTIARLWSEWLVKKEVLCDSGILKKIQ